MPKKTNLKKQAILMTILKRTFQNNKKHTQNQKVNEIIKTNTFSDFANNSVENS